MANDGGMVDVSGKDITVRTAKADGCILLGDESFEVVKRGTCIKGDVFCCAATMVSAKQRWRRYLQDSQKPTR